MTAVGLYQRVTYGTRDGVVQQFADSPRGVLADVAWDDGSSSWRRVDALRPELPKCSGCGCRLVNLDAEWTPPGGQRWADDNRLDYDNTATDCDRTDSGVHEPVSA